MNCSIAHSSTLSRLLAFELDRELAGFQLVEQLDRCSRLPPPPCSSTCRLAAGQAAELVVAQPVARIAVNVSPGPRCVEPARDQALDGGVELVGRHAPEQRPADRRARARGRRARRCRRPAAATPPSSRTVVPWKPRSPTQCWAQACGQPSRWSRSSAIWSPNLASRLSISRPRRVFVSATEKLQCGSPVQAIEVAAHRVDVEREADLAELGHGLVDLALRDAGDDEVLLARQPDVAAEALGQVGDRDHLVAGDEAEVDGNADVREALLLLRVDADVVRRLDRDRRQREVLELPAEPPSTRSRMPSGPMSSTMNFSRAFTRETRYLRSSDQTSSDRAQDLDRVLLRDEDAQVARDPRHRREPAADEDARSPRALRGPRR